MTAQPETARQPVEIYDGTEPFILVWCGGDVWGAALRTDPGHPIEQFATMGAAWVEVVRRNRYRNIRQY